ncbi:MAG: Na+/H+ antiporter NhaA, partial [Acidimicrobiales bacterium]
MSNHTTSSTESPLAPVRLPRLVRQFVQTEVSGGVVLLVAAAVALVWANSPWQQSYRDLWDLELSFGFGTFLVVEDLRHWVNEALMAVFFFVVGLEIKRELVTGELRRWRTAALPAVAALGGMVVPALLYLAVNAGGTGSRGWGIPMATDIAFALGVVALMGRRVPGPLKLFLLTLAIVDDIGAIVVIAVFYSSGIEPGPLAAAAGLIGLMGALRLARVRSLAPFVIIGVGVWFAVFESGVHATLAGVVLGLLAPARPETPEGLARDWAADLSDEPTPEDLRTMTTLARSSTSVAERLQHGLHPWTSFLIVPLFALANAGVSVDRSALSDAGRSPVTLGIVAGLVIGKVVGISAFSWLAVRSGLGALPTGVRFAQVVAVAAVAGVGFTVSLFIADLAFVPVALQDEAKIGVLVASA